ncbi:MAG: hypothetical protein D6801_01515 [Alphaproteobacteria bacterium]|nr:MAG: hypothetical protein D6801_01515 [Alphaproteobacteria bacterium]
MARLTFLPYFLVAAFGFGLSWVQTGHLVRQVSPDEHSASLVLTAILTLLVTWVLWSFMAILVHRLLLLGDTVATHGMKRPVLGKYLWKSLAIGVRVVAFYVVAVIVPSVVLLPRLMDSQLTAPGEAPPMPLAFTAVLYLVVMVATWLGFRWSLVLPAAAVEDNGLTIGDSWRETRPFRLEILVASAVLTGLLVVIDLLTNHVIGGRDLGALVSTVLNWPVAVFGVVILTLLYRTCSGGRDPRQRAAKP